MVSCPYEGEGSGAAPGSTSKSSIPLLLLVVVVVLVLVVLVLITLLLWLLRLLLTTPVAKPAQNPLFSFLGIISVVVVIIPVPIADWTVVPFIFLHFRRSTATFAAGYMIKPFSFFRYAFVLVFNPAIFV